MFNYQVDWNRVIKENIPGFLVRLLRVNTIRAMVKPFKIIHTEFLLLKDEYINKVAYNGQTNYLEKILNDTFDNTGRGIYISDYGIINQNYLYKKSEVQPPIYLYRRWKNTQPYGVGDYAADGNSVYTSLTVNSGSQPSLNIRTDWAYYKEVTFFKKKSEYNMSGGFVVNIPTSLVFDELRLRALVDYYRLASRLYIIVLY